MNRGGVGMIYKCRSRILEQNQGIYWHQRTQRHRLQLGCPWMGGRESNTIYWFHISFRSPEERERIWSPFGKQPIGWDISPQCIVGGQRGQLQLPLRAKEFSRGIYWRQRIWRRRLLHCCPFLEGRIPNMIAWFHTSFRSPEERGCIWSPFGRQPIEWDISPQCIVGGQRERQQFPLRAKEFGQGIYWHQRTWRHRLLLGCPWMGGRESNTKFWFHTSFRSPEERGCIQSPFGRQPIGWGISPQCIVGDQQEQQQLILQVC